MNWPAIKQFGLDTAELADAWRVGPRMLMVFYLYQLERITTWFMSRPIPVDNAHAAFVSLTWGFLVPLAGWYMSTGRRWQ